MLVASLPMLAQPRYIKGVLHVEEASLERIALNHGTPCYVYSSRVISDNYKAYVEALKGIPHQVCYSVKANSNLSILKLLARMGSGFDIVSGGELYRVMQAGGDPSKVVFSGVGKSAQEMEYALRVGIHSFNCESEGELKLLSELAQKPDQKARVSLRVNPDVDPETHPYIATGLEEHKFGIAISEAEALYERARRLPNIVTTGISCHIGSQILNPAPLLQALDRILALAGRLREAGHRIDHIDIGGGLGIAYRPEDRKPEIAGFLQEVRQRIGQHKVSLYLEPGRSIVGESGVLLSRVLYRKRNKNKEFVIVDAAMNDLIRPALYHSHHEIWAVQQPEGETFTADIVGPVCETGDFFARDRQMPVLEPSDLVAICATGAYGFVLASNYNSRPRAAEILVEGGSWRVVRNRETYEDLVRLER